MWTLPFQGIHNVYTKDGKKIFDDRLSFGKWQSNREVDGEKAYRSCDGYGTIYLDCLDRLMEKGDYKQFLPKERKEKIIVKECGKDSCMSSEGEQLVQRYMKQYKNDDVISDSACGCHFERRFI